MKKLSVIFRVLLLLNFSSAFGQTEEGGYAGAFLEIPVDARPAGMGGAYTAIADDVAGQLYNPGGLASLTDETFSSSYRKMGLGRSLGFVSLVFPTRQQSAMGLSWQYVGYGETEERGEDSYPTGNMISSTEHAFGLTFAKRFESFVSAGIKLNYFHKEVAGLSAGSIGIDLGLLLYVDSLYEFGTMDGKPVTDIRIGLTGKNFAAKYLWEETNEGLAPAQTDKFPAVMMVGASCRTFQRSLLLAVDFEKNMEQDPVLHLGTEYIIEDNFAVRAGLNDGVVTAGAGFRFNVQKLSFSIDYGFSDDRVGEGGDHIITLDIKL